MAFSSRPLTSNCPTGVESSTTLFDGDEPSAEYARASSWPESKKDVRQTTRVAVPDDGHARVAEAPEHLLVDDQLVADQVAVGAEDPSDDLRQAPGRALVDDHEVLVDPAAARRVRIGERLGRVDRERDRRDRRVEDQRVAGRVDRSSRSSESSKTSPSSRSAPAAVRPSASMPVTPPMCTPPCSGCKRSMYDSVAAETRSSVSSRPRTTRSPRPAGRCVEEERELGAVGADRPVFGDAGAASGGQLGVAGARRSGLESRLRVPAHDGVEGQGDGRSRCVVGPEHGVAALELEAVGGTGADGRLGVEESARAGLGVGRAPRRRGPCSRRRGGTGSGVRAAWRSPVDWSVGGARPRSRPTDPGPGGGVTRISD